MGLAVSDRHESVPPAGVRQLPRRAGTGLPPAARLSMAGSGSARDTWAAPLCSHHGMRSTAGDRMA